MVQFSFYIFILNVACIVYLMNSGEEYSKDFAQKAQTNYSFMKFQFFLMAVCYIGLAYGVLANNEILEDINYALKSNLQGYSYYLFVGGYVMIHAIWGSHFVDLSIRAHIFKHSKKGVYSTRVSRLLTSLFHSKKTIKNGN